MDRSRAPLAFALVLGGCAIGSEPPIDPAIAADLRAAEARVAQSPEDPEALIQLGQVEAKANRWFLAADHFRAATEKAPDDARGLAGLGEAYVRLAYWGPAYQTLARCAQMQGGNEDCLIRLGYLLRSDGSQAALVQARQLLNRFLEIAPNHPRAEEVRTALRQIEVQVATTPANPAGPGPKTGAGTGPGPGAGPGEIPEHRGVQGDEDVGELNPFGEAYGRAVAAMQNNDPVTAEKAILEALKVEPNDPGAQAFLAEALLSQNKMEGAIAAAEKAYASDSTDPYARWVIGLVLIKSGKDMKRAIEAWRALAKDTPDLAEKLGVKKTLDAVDGAPPGAHP